MKKLILLFSLLMMIQCISYAQVRINNRPAARPVDSANLTTPKLTGIQTTQPATPQQNAAQGTSLYYSVDPTAFSVGWGTYEIQKMSPQGVYLINTNAGNGSAPYLVAPVNLPHNARVSTMTVVFYDVSPNSDLQVILWRSGTDFNYNLAQIESNYNGGYVAQAVAINTIIDNQNYSYSVSVSPKSGTQWPGNTGNLRIKRITIAYTLP